MKEMIDYIVRIIILWTVGNLGGVFFRFLIVIGRIGLFGYERRKFIPPKEGLIWIHNHPSLWEALILNFLSWPIYLFWPSFTPYSTPEIKNYFQKKNKWWSFLIRPFCIPIDRESKRGLREIVRKINDGKIVNTAPEGGRTPKGEEFKVIQKGGKIVIKKKNELTPDDIFKIRRFQEGFSALLGLTKAPLLPIWTQGGDKVLPNELWSQDGKYIFPSGPYFLRANLKAKVRIVIGEWVKGITDISVLEDILLKLSQDGTSVP